MKIDGKCLSLDQIQILIFNDLIFFFFYKITSSKLLQLGNKRANSNKLSERSDVRMVKFEIKNSI